jgi:hypothetical protein
MMQRDYVLYEITMPGKKKDYRFFIFMNDASAVHFEDLGDEFSYIEDEILENPDLWEPQDSFAQAFQDNFNRFMDSGKHIAVLKHTNLLAGYFAQLLPLFEQWEIKPHFLSFFHNDADTESLALDWGRNALERKVVMIDNMNRFPWIDKFEVPPDFWLDIKYLGALYGYKAKRKTKSG